MRSIGAGGSLRYSVVHVLRGYVRDSFVYVSVGRRGRSCCLLMFVTGEVEVQECEEFGELS